MFAFQQGSLKHKSIIELSKKTNKELKMKYLIDRMKVKHSSSFPHQGGNNCTHKNNIMKPRVYNGIMETSSRWKYKI